MPSKLIIVKMCLLVAALIESPKTESQLQHLLSLSPRKTVHNYLGFFHSKGLLYLEQNEARIKEGGISNTTFCLQKIPFEKDGFLPDTFSLSGIGLHGQYATVDLFVEVFALLLTGEPKTAKEISEYIKSKDETIHVYLKAMHVHKIIYFVDARSHKITSKGKVRKCIERTWRVQPSIGACEDVALRKPKVGNQPGRKPKQLIKHTQESQQKLLPSKGWIPNGFY